jgi:hypothetical protein
MLNTDSVQKAGESQIANREPRAAVAEAVTEAEGSDRERKTYDDGTDPSGSIGCVGSQSALIA